MINSASRIRLSTGHFAMILAGLLGVSLTLWTLNANDKRVEIAVAKREVAAGESLERSDIKFELLSTSRSVNSALIERFEVRSVLGRIATTNIPQGEIINPARFSASTQREGHRQIALPVPRERAVGGTVKAGDRIDIFLSGDTGGIVGSGIEVTKVVEDEKAFGGSNTISLVLSVDENTIGPIGAIVGNENVTVAISTGAEPLEMGVTNRPHSSYDGTTDVVESTVRDIPGNKS